MPLQVTEMSYSCDVYGQQFLLWFLLISLTGKSDFNPSEVQSTETAVLLGLA